MYNHLFIIGILLVALALMHSVFPRYFDWSNELKTLSLINRQMMTVHTFFIALTVFAMGLLCLTSANELISTTIGKRISLGLGVFWLIRLIIQLFVYSKELWSGKKFETGVHIFFTLLWAYLSSVFLWVFFN